jgi:hypothetical protein
MQISDAANGSALLRLLTSSTLHLGFRTAVAREECAGRVRAAFGADVVDRSRRSWLTATNLGGAQGAVARVVGRSVVRAVVGADRGEQAPATGFYRRCCRPRREAAQTVEASENRSASLAVLL